MALKNLEPNIIKLIIDGKEKIEASSIGKAVFVDLRNFPYQNIAWFKTTDEFCTFEELQNGEIQ